MCCQEEEGDPPIVPGLGTRTDSTLLFSTTTRFCIGVEFHLSRGGGGGGGAWACKFLPRGGGGGGPGPLSPLYSTPMLCCIC